uniref:Zgc:158417 n=1 Tax=Cyprinus carpio TaxID=7962 RepID=A0A8C1QLI0_CYPCA
MIICLLILGSSMQSMLRVVLFRNTGADKNKVIKSMLIGENLTGEKNGLCTLYKNERAGRRISVVEAPGWHGHSQQTPENIKEEITRSVLLCPPGPHALLLVIPVKTLSEEPSVGEMNAAEMHMELLSERVWKHTIVRFACDEGTSACGSQTQNSELFQKIDSLVEESRGDVFIPQAYYELIQKKTQEASGATELSQRRGSLQHNPPNSEYYFTKPTFVLILMGAFGALLGSVAGAENGVRGSFIGVVFGIFVGVLVALFIMYVYTHFYSKQTTQSAS